ncbi:MAG: lytic transglycosylase domain-containing protein [Dechloromonas sp.]|uniref:Lytic transglycosylase domain-containing protein n=1 Tax=Candidatus Dechloromonas phosphorivorans TaxID=2899244 RepID=A0A9D7LPY6_9RHOO|nr:lytic transglycosylase domain-containing protein [Candidatus Dechloromonas phosphorivorans]
MKFPALLLALFVSLPLFAQEGRDSTYLAARDAFRAGDRARLDRAAGQIGNHELAPYVENYQLRMTMDQGDSTALRGFFERYERSYVAEKLRADWIRWLGKRGGGSEIVVEYPKLIAPEPDVTCWFQQARLASGDKAAFDDVQQLWLTMLEPPEACRAVLDALIRDNRVTIDDIWARAHRQFEAGRTGPAKLTLAALPAGQTADAKALDMVIGSPMGYLAKQPATWSASRTGRELAALAIQRVAANDPRAAAAELGKLQGRMQEPERQWAWSQIGLQAAKRHYGEALAWYAQGGETPLSDEGAAWKVRAALRAHDWSVVLATISEMPAALAAQPEWIYWLGRAYKAGGLTSEAEALFEKIAGQASFYGNLADEELGRKILTPPKAKAPTAEEQKAARDNPAIRRAMAFFRLEMRTEAVREWNWSLRGMDDRELLAAADLARRNQIWDRAINTADRTKSEHDFTLRFLAPYGDQVRPAARDQALDDAWVYGLMRQESRFITSAKSNVGASGLMQLMPATAKWVAKKIGLRNYDHGRVNDTETNVLLGTSYMRLVMENLDNHPVLTSAAYNAGPGRAKRWRADRPLEGAVYAETIPFNETRDYVKKVMSNSVYYSMQFTGRPDSLKARLGVVGARAEDVPKDADLP